MLCWLAAMSSTSVMQATDFGQNDDRMSGYEDCAQQRNLTDRGRSDARAIGAAIRRLRIPVSSVFASPFCRTRETAELIFGHATVDARVRGGPARPDNPERYAELRTLMSTPVPGGTNVAIVSHGNPFTAVAGPPYLAEGEAAVIHPSATANSASSRGFRRTAGQGSNDVSRGVQRTVCLPWPKRIFRDSSSLIAGLTLIVFPIA